MQTITGLTFIKGNPPHALEAIRAIASSVQIILIGDIGINSSLKQAIETEFPQATYILLPPETLIAEIAMNEMIEKVNSEYILYFDPDELFPKTLIDYLITNGESADCWYIPRKNYIFHEWIKTARWWPDHQLRFFKKNAVSWPKQVHAVPNTKGTTKKISPEENLAIIHHNYESVDEFIDKFIKYAKLDAQNDRSLDLSKTFEKIKTEFISRYYAFDGYTQQNHGFLLSWMQMFYYSIVYLYQWEKHNFTDNNQTIPQQVEAFFLSMTKEMLHWKKEKKIPPLPDWKEAIIQKLIK